MKSSDSPAYVVKQTAVGIASIGANVSNDHLLPTIPVMQTIPPFLVQSRESLSVVVPTSSRSLSTPPAQTSLTCSAIDPVSMHTWSTPLSRSSVSRLDLRFIEATISRCLL